MGKKSFPAGKRDWEMKTVNCDEVSEKSLSLQNDKEKNAGSLNKVTGEKANPTEEKQERKMWTKDGHQKHNR